ncbi:MAG TPA: hypothetical protein DIT09_07505 [Glutamicibacter sp.]|uniref:hypothetical protein n=1 Tax=Glutamicibacter arilaitensis TaxID=256701 RepID=UPI000ECA5240|nr:hypothetical protein [Glutamicibacter sp.]
MNRTALPRLAAARRKGRWRLMLMLPAMLCLLSGLDAALILLDLPAPMMISSWGQAHGLLLVFGFAGSLIALERAVALGKLAGYAAPLCLSLGGLTQLFTVPQWIPAGLFIAGLAALLGVYIPLWRRQRAHAVMIQMIGACAGLGAAILWAGAVQISLLLPWLAVFLIATIAGERVELARIQISARAEHAAVLLNLGLLLAAAASTLFVQIGSVLFGCFLLGLVIWLVRHDVARRTINSTGAPRFMAACLLAGYFWLLVAAVVWSLGYPASTARYDTVIHAVFLGFAISMIMAHASTILPAVLAINLPYHRAMWIPAAMLHLGLVLRIWLGDGLGVQILWKAGGASNVAALLVFAAIAVYSALQAAGQAKKEAAHHA